MNTVHSLFMHHVERQMEISHTQWIPTSQHRVLHLSGRRGLPSEDICFVIPLHCFHCIRHSWRKHRYIYHANAGGGMTFLLLPQPLLSIEVSLQLCVNQTCEA